MEALIAGATILEWGKRMNLEKKTREEVIEKLSNFLSIEEGIILAYIHGSFLTESTFNDIDVAVYLNDEILSRIDVVDFEIDESLRAEGEIGLPVDIRVLNVAPLCFRYRASSGNLLFSHDEDTLERFLCSTWREYFDFEPVSRLYLKEGAWVKFNIDRIRQLAGEINSALFKLNRIAQLNEVEFLADSDKIDSAKYNLVVAIEGTIDICNHIVAKAGGRAPSDYADGFRILAELGVLEEEFAKRLQKMAKFRNLLVHLYWQVDNKRVYKILKEDIIDLKNYLGWIGKYIGSEL